MSAQFDYGAGHLCPRQLNEQAKAQTRSADVELTIVPGATHLFEEPGMLEQVEQVAGDWFVRYLHPA